MTKTETVDGLNITTRTADDTASGRAYTREHRHAVRETSDGYGMIDLKIHATDGFAAFYVTSSVNRGRGWSKGKRSIRFATESEARAYADRRWPVIVAWLQSAEIVRSNFQPDFTTH